jgi:hemolysin D
MTSAKDPLVTAAAALRQRPPARVARMISMSVCGMGLAGIVYACLAHVDVVVTAQGRVVPSGRSKVVQPLEAGIVRAVHVRDGQRVRSAELLVELDPTSTGADKDRLRRELWEAETDVARLAAMLAGQPGFVAGDGAPLDVVANQRAMLSSRLAEQHAKTASLDADVARREADRDATAANLDKLRNTLPWVRKKHAMREKLAEAGHIAETGLIETRLEVIVIEKELAVGVNRLKEAAAGLASARQQRIQAVAEFRARSSSELVDATRRRDAVEQELIKARQRGEWQMLRAPIDGIVQQLAVTTVGGVVTPAQQLMVVVPENTPLEVEAQVQNKDVGHLRPGQRVIHKIETFDFTRYGYIEGEVQWVGNDAIADPKLGPVYPVRLKLAAAQTPNAVNGHQGVVSAGMSVSADVRTGERRLIEYLLSPMLRYLDEALRER